jgi:hypothetical protein
VKLKLVPNIMMMKRGSARVSYVRSKKGRKRSEEQTKTMPDPVPDNPPGLWDQHDGMTASRAAGDQACPTSGISGSSDDQ